MLCCLQSTSPLQAEGQQVQQQPQQQQEQYTASDQDQHLQPQTQQEGLPVSSVDVSSDLKLHPTALFERASAALDQRHSAASDDPLQYVPCCFTKMRSVTAALHC